MANGLNVLMYPYGHCLNSHLLNVEKMGKVLARYGHQVSIIVSDRYSTFGHVNNRRTSDASGCPATEQKRHQSIHGTGGQVEMIMFQAPGNFTPICEYDTVEFIVDTPVSIRFRTFIETSVRYCDRLLADKLLMQSLKNRSFDVFIVEAVDPCGKILADWLDIPFITLMTTGLGHGDGNMRLPSHVPAPISWFTPDMTLGQRIVNVFLKVMYDVLPAMMKFTEPFEELKIKYSLNTSLSLANTFDRAALNFVNSDFALEYSVPITPDTVLIGGLFLEEPKGLDQELSTFIHSSGPEGIIVVSMGTLVGRYSARWTQMFLSAFARLPQKVIWRYGGKVESTVNDSFVPYSQSFPSNVLVRHWLPQAELLAHPKTRLFVTHCGLNAVFETVRAAVPVVALPLSGDQFYQAAKLADHAKMGVHLDITKITADDLYEAMKNVMQEPEYKRRASIVSAKLLDQPLPVGDKVNYWLNYVVRHKDLRHLRSAGRNLTWFQYYSVDVVAILLVALLTVFSSLFLFTKYFFHVCYNSLVSTMTSHD